MQFLKPHFGKLSLCNGGKITNPKSIVLFPDGCELNQKMVTRQRWPAEEFTELRPPAEEVASLAEKLVAAHALPSNEIIDAFHIATATVSKMNYLLTWNCKHLANYSALPKTYSVLTSAGYSCPVIITPEKYMEELNYE